MGCSFCYPFMDNCWQMTNVYILRSREIMLVKLASLIMRLILFIVIALGISKQAHATEDYIQSYFKSAQETKALNPEFYCSVGSRTPYKGGELITDYTRLYYGGISIRLRLGYGPSINLASFVGNSDSYTYNRSPSDFTDEEILRLAQIAFKTLFDKCNADYEDYKIRIYLYKKKIE